MVLILTDIARVTVCSSLMDQLHQCPFIGNRGICKFLQGGLLQIPLHLLVAILSQEQPSNSSRVQLPGASALDHQLGPGWYPGGEHLVDHGQHISLTNSQITDHVLSV